MSQQFDFSKYLQTLGITTPTPIQSLCFEPLWQGKNTKGLAPTGSGKTLAFLLPSLLRLSKKKRAIQVLILAPTRELGTQIAKVASQVSQVIKEQDQHNILITTAFGGAPVSGQIEEIQKNPHVLIATPGRVLDLLERKALLPKDLQTLILDEADIMVGMGFGPDVENICKFLPENVQVAFFSATENEKVTSLEKFLFQKQTPVVCDTKSLNKETEQLHDAPIKHQFILSSKEKKFQDLYTYLKQIEDKKLGKMIVFCHQRETTHQLAESLKKRGLSADALTGELGQVERNSIMRNFKTGNLQYLVATNIAARGIDIEKLAGVVHYDIPYTQEDYIHRSGRTGRSGFLHGFSLTFCEEKNKHFYLKLMDDLKLPFEEIQLADLAKDSPKKNVEKKRDFIKIHLNKGKQNKMRPGDILGALIQDLGLQKEDIGSIFIFNNFTHVEIDVLKKQKILNKNFSVKKIPVKAVEAK